MLCPMDEVVEITQGAKGEFEVALVDETGRPVDGAADYDGYYMLLPKTRTTTLKVDKAINAQGSVMTQVGAPELAVWNVFIAPADTALLGDGERLDMELTLTNSVDANDIIKVPFTDRLVVIKAAPAAS